MAKSTAVIPSRRQRRCIRMMDNQGRPPDAPDQKPMRNGSFGPESTLRHGYAVLAASIAHVICEAPRECRRTPITQLECFTCE